MPEEYDEFSALMRRRAWPEAVAFAEGLTLREGQEDAFWLTQYSRALSSSGGHTAALAAARRAQEVRPGNPFAMSAEAEALLGLERTAEALELFRELSHHERLAERAGSRVLECLVRMERWDEALQEAATLSLPEARTLGWRAMAHAGRGEVDEAIALCRRWLEISPHFPPALWQLTDLEIERDGLDAVVDRMQKMAKIPSLPPVYREIYASLCTRSGRTEQAMREYEKLSGTGAQNRIQRKQAFLLAKSGRETEALPLLEALLEDDPRDVYLHSSYSAACTRIHDEERGINFYNRLLTRYPEERGLYGRITRLRRGLEARS